MSAELEATYRRALRWYPQRWRAVNEDVVLGTLMEQAEHDHRAVPAAGELRNLRANAVRDRVGVARRVVPIGVRTRAATIALALAFTVTAAGLVLNVWQLRRFSGGEIGFTQAGPLGSVGMIYYAVWIVALIFTFIGLRRVSAVLVAATLPVAVVLASVPAFRGSSSTPGSVTIGFLELLAVLYVIGLPTANRRFRIELATISGTLLVLFAAIYWMQTLGYWGDGALGVDYFWAPFAIWLTFLGSPAVVVASLIVWRMRRSPWAPAMLLAAVPLIPLTLFEFGQHSSWIINVGIAVAVLAGVAVALGILRLFGIRLRMTRV